VHPSAPDQPGLSNPQPNILTLVPRYSGFDSALFRNLDAKWHFPQENATLLDLQMSTRESKPL